MQPLDVKQFIRGLGALPMARLRAARAGRLLRSVIQSSSPLSANARSAMVFAPHQDDETFGCGGMIALKRSLNVPVEVVFLTDGCQSHGTRPAGEARKLVLARKREALQAVSMLGITPPAVHFLDQPDGGLETLSCEEHRRLIQQLVHLLQSFQPEEVYVPHRKDRHVDHEATYRLVKAALVESELRAELLQYPVWLLWQAPMLCNAGAPEFRGAYQLAIGPARDAKDRAIEAYHSQHQSTAAGAGVLPDGFLKQFLAPYELFFKEEGSPL
ncbi:MAG: PIG-L family deacetylase [Gemmatimonadaceae bacterium]|nr:PIG-L family deacetylase [Gloeobacterales cyanobacterium ES-bin-141]